MTQNYFNKILMLTNLPTFFFLKYPSLGSLLPEHILHFDSSFISIAKKYFFGPPLASELSHYENGL